MTGRKPQEVVKIFDREQSEETEMKNPAESGVSAGFFNICAGGAVSGL